MDTTEITHLSLCSGYGGLDLGIKGVFGENCRTVAYAEIEAFAVECLLARMEGGSLDAAPIWPNLKSFPWAAFSDRVDILSGGYPCQPFSAAGKRLGTEDPRHLWPFIANGIWIMRPKLCFFENVEGHISLGLREVVGELESMGYKVSWGIFSAREVGAPHQRKRVFILAHRNNARQLQHALRVATEAEHATACGSSAWPARPGELAYSNNGRGGEDKLLSELRATGIEQSSRCTRLPSQSTQVRKITVWPSRPGEQQFAWEPPRVVTRLAVATNTDDEAWRCERHNNRCNAIWNDNQRNRQSEHRGTCCDTGRSQGCEAEPPLGRNPHGPSHRLDYAELCVSGDNRNDELRLLGNGVVPATATKAFLTLLEDLIK